MSKYDLYKIIENELNNQKIIIKEFNNNIYDYDFLIKKYKKNLFKDEFKGKIPSNQEHKIEPEEPVELLFDEEQHIKAFLFDSTRVLTYTSPRFLKNNENVIIASLKRDITSVNCLNFPLSDVVYQTLIEEATRQRYVFSSYTHYRLLHDETLIKISLEQDFNSIIFIPNQAWTSELQTFATELAIKKDYLLNQHSPNFLSTNLEVIKHSIRLDNKSSRFISWDLISSEDIDRLSKDIVSEELPLIIGYNTPKIICQNIAICIKSAELSPKSLVYVDFEYLKDYPEELEKLYDALVSQNYVLTAYTPDEVSNNTKICLNSIKKDINSARFIGHDLQDWIVQDLDEFLIENDEDKQIINRILEIRHYLLANNYYSMGKYNNFLASLLKDPVVLDYYLANMGISKDAPTETGKLYYTRVKEFINASLKTPLKISDAKKFFQVVAAKEWEVYRQENAEIYNNIFNRICDALEANSDFTTAISELQFLTKVEKALDNQKYLLYNSLVEYHQIYHNPHVENKLVVLQAKRDEISQYAALFVSKSKDNFIKEKITAYERAYKGSFMIKTDSPFVKKRIIEIKQREKLKELFNNQDPAIMEKIERIREKYLAHNFVPSLSKDKIPEIIDLFISKTINDNVSSIDDILLSSKPPRFDEYELYEKITKVINRLNSHNINFDSREVDKYRSFIIYDGQKYIYNGSQFTETELAQIVGYKDLKYVFGKVKSDIIQIAKGIDKLPNITKKDLELIINECPFTDEHFTFKSLFDRYYIRVFNRFINEFENHRSTLLDDKSYQLIQDLVFNNGLFQLSAATGVLPNTSEIEKYFDQDSIINIITNLPTIMTILSPEELTSENMPKILEIIDMLKYADLQQISILDKEVIQKIYSNNGYTMSSQSKRIDVACDLVSAMVSRSESTVPYITGNHNNYHYSMYDSTDTTLLTSGLDTNACFRCCGHDNDFLHYCALDKNGFVIKLTDQHGNFIGRASGFRNGNGVYINQLRTIYDKKSTAYSSERSAIIATFKKACEDIVNTSQNNPDEKNKIDFVVVTKSYTLSDTDSNVSEATTQIIGLKPMENQSEDWRYFISNTKNLYGSPSTKWFPTDYGNYPLICMASSVGQLNAEKIKPGDVPAVYKRARKKVDLSEPTETIESLVNHIKAIYCYQVGESFNYLKLPKNSQIITGDNWYIVVGPKGILDHCCLPTDTFARQEYTSFMEQILSNKKPFPETPPNNPRGK